MQPKIPDKTTDTSESKQTDTPQLKQTDISQFQTATYHPEHKQQNYRSNAIV